MTKRFGYTSEDFRQLRFRDAPKPPHAARLVFSEQAQLFFEIFGQKGQLQLFKEMREVYWQARYLTPAKERKDMQGMARLALDEATTPRKRRAS